MNIGIDGYEANTEKRVGIGQYAFQVVSNLSKLDKQNSYTIFLPSEPLSDMPEESQNWRYSVGKSGGFWTILQLPRLIRRNPVDLFFSPTHYVPWFSQVPKVFSIMDLSYLHYPEMFRKKDLIQLKHMTKFSLKRAQKVFTISEFSKREIIEYYKYPEKDIVFTYPGIHKYQLSNIKDQKNKTIKPYILFVGTLQPRKNIQRLIKAFELINDSNIELMLVGKKGWLWEPIIKTIKESTKKDAIRILDFVPDEELTSLYQNATCFVLPSLYEGFGIPVLEAMHFGCPVVISNTSSLPEVGGEAAIYVNPLETQDIARGMDQAIQLDSRQRKELVERGKKQVQKFSWKTCAQQTLEVLNSFS